MPPLQRLEEQKPEFENFIFRNKKILHAGLPLKYWKDLGLKIETSSLIIITLGGVVEVRCGRRLIIARNPGMIPALTMRLYEVVILSLPCTIFIITLLLLDFSSLCGL